MRHVLNLRENTLKCTINPINQALSIDLSIYLSIYLSI